MAIKIQEERIKLLLSEIRKGKKRADCVANHCKKFQISSRTFDTDWKKATLRFLEAEQKAKEAADAEYIRMQADAAKDAAMSRIERMSILTKIARGQIILKKPIVVGGKIKNVESVPDWMDRKNAIAELNKMDGEYAAIKQKLVDDDDKAIKPPTLILQMPQIINHNLPSNTDGQE